MVIPEELVNISSDLKYKLYWKRCLVNLNEKTQPMQYFEPVNLCNDSIDTVLCIIILTNIFLLFNC